MEVTWIIGLATVAIILLPIIWKLLDKKIALIKNEKLRMALEEISDVKVHNMKDTEEPCIRLFNAKLDDKKGDFVLLVRSG